MTSCCTKKTIVTGLVTAVYAWFFDFLWHGNLLMSEYEAHKAMFRPMEQMQSMMAYCIAYHLAMGLLVAAGYLCWRSKVTVGAVGSSECPYRKSMGFGLWVGLVLGVPQMMAYMWLPFESAYLPIMWGVGEILKWTIAGIVLNKLNGCCNKPTNTVNM